MARKDLNIAGILEARMNRRHVLRMLGVSGAAFAGSSLLAACGGDDADDPDETSVPPTAPAAGATATTASGSGGGATSPAGATEPAGATAPATTDSTATTGAVAGGSERHFGFPVEPAENEGGTLVVTYDAVILNGLNPLVNTFEYGIGYFVFESLVDINPNSGELVPNLAESFEISADALTYTFKIREGVTWHDGETFDASDVKFTFDAHLSGETNSNYYSVLDTNVESVEQPDDVTFVINMKQPNVTFGVSPLAEIQMVAQHVFGDTPFADYLTHPATTGSDPAQVVGTGPFKFKEIVLDDHTAATRYDNYWDGKPHLDEVINIVGDQQTSAQRLKVGEIDFTVEVPASQVEEFRNSDTIRMVSWMRNGLRFMGPNLDPEQIDLFQDVNVRRALLHAIDRELMVEAVLFGQGEVSESFFPSSSWVYDLDSVEFRYPYDVDLAGSLLDEAGWTLGADGIREKDGRKFSFTFLSTTADEEYVVLGETVQEFWRKIGVDAQLTLEEFSAYTEHVFEKHDYHMVAYRYWWDMAFDFTFAFASDQYPAGSNWGAYSNPDVDAKLAEAASEPDFDKRTALLRELDNLLLEDLPVLPMYAPMGNAFIANRVHNIFPSNAGWWPNPETIWVDA